MEPRASVARPLLIGGERLRQQTDKPRGGGGSKYYPFSVEESAARLLPQAASIYATAREIPERLRGRQLILEATLMPNFLANSYFPGELLSYLDASGVGTRYSTAPRRSRAEPDGSSDEPTKSLYVAADNSSLGRLEALLANPTSRAVPKGVKEDLQVIERLVLPTPDDRLSISEPLLAERTDLPLMEAVLHPSGGARGARPSPADPDVVRKWIALIASLGGVVETEWIRTAGSLTFMPVRLDETAFAGAAEFNALRSFHPMPAIRPSTDPQRRPVDPIPEPQRPEPVRGGTALRIAVFDGGCDEKSPYYAGRVRDIEVGTIVPDDRFRRHGALVTSALLYGPDPDDPLTPANVLIDHYRVIPAAGQTGLEMYWLLDIIRSVVDDNDYHVVNLSLGPKRSLEDDLVDLWTSELDELAHRRDVLFVVAAGNDGASDIEELRRIQVPGDMVNGLTVGACDSQSPARRTPYSSLGPGRAGARMQPSGVAFGGTSNNRFLGIDSDGVPIADVGTSFSVPFAIHGLADLATRTSVRLVTPVTLKAFALHFTKKCHRDEPVEHVGYGQLPASYREALDCPENVVHLLYRGTIARNEYVPFALPLPDDAEGRIRLRWTLATSVATDPADSVEYAKAGLEVVFRPHSNRRSFTKSGKQTKVVDVIDDPVEAARLIGEGYSPSQEPASETPKLFKGEAALREEGKWETVRQSEKRFNAGRLYRPRLDLAHIAREGGALSYDTPDLNYALLATLVSENGTGLYDRVLAQYPVLVPLTAGVDVTVATT